MTVNESIIEDAAFDWFRELGFAVGHRPHLATGEAASERGSFVKLVLVGRLRLRRRTALFNSSCAGS